MFRQIFNNEVDAYQSWTLFLIFVSILILISGVVLLTHKKPEPVNTPSITLEHPPPGKKRKRRKEKRSGNGQEDVEEGEQDMLWTVGDDSGEEDAQELGVLEYGDGDEDVDHHQNPLALKYKHKGVLSEDGVVKNMARGKGKDALRKGEGEEGVGLMGQDEDGDEDEDEEQVMDRYRHRPLIHISRSTSGSSLASTSRPTLSDPPRGWEGGGKQNEG